MKFYLCQTEDGPQYFHLQAEAKKADPNFQTVELDTAKGPLMDLLNDLMRQAHGRGSAPATPKAVPPKPGEIGTFAEGNEPKREDKWTTQAKDIREGRRCNVCETRESIAKWRASGDAANEIEELVLRITNKSHLDNIATLIEGQQAGLK